MSSGKFVNFRLTSRTLRCRICGAFPEVGTEICHGRTHFGRTPSEWLYSDLRYSTKSCFSWSVKMEAVVMAVVHFHKCLESPIVKFVLLHVGIAVFTESDIFYGQQVMYFKFP